MVAEGRRAFPGRASETGRGAPYTHQLARPTWLASESERSCADFAPKRRRLTGVKTDLGIARASAGRHRCGGTWTWRRTPPTARPLDGIFSLATGLSRVLGLVREMVATYYFGAAGPDQLLHGRVPAAEPRPGAGGGRGALVGVRPVFSGLLEKGERKRAWRVASSPVLADPPRPRRDHGAPDADRAAAPSSRSTAATTSSPSGSPRVLFPDRRPARALRDHRRDPEFVRPVHRSPRSLRSPGTSRSSSGSCSASRPSYTSDDEALRLRRIDPCRHLHPVPAAAAPGFAAGTIDSSS